MERRIKMEEKIKFTNEVKGKSQVVCYDCKKHGHFKSKCLSFEKENEKKTFFKKKKKKGLMVT
ncbi:hypothetical protein CR513_41372, partial [Mucuna pruriens]